MFASPSSSSSCIHTLADQCQSTNDFSRWTFVVFLQKKSAVIAAYTKWMTMAQLQTGINTNLLQSPTTAACTCHPRSRRFAMTAARRTRRQ